MTSTIVLSSSGEPSTSSAVLSSDVVAGARLDELRDESGANRFSITDLPGFDPATLGGTTLSDSFHFVVRYTGTIDHPGGAFGMREVDDAVEDAVWGFVGDGVGGVTAFLEVHGWIWPDRTSDEPSITLPAGPVDIEIVILRCAVQIAPIAMQVRSGGGAWTTIGSAPTAPAIDETLFPPVL